MKSHLNLISVTLKLALALGLAAATLAARGQGEIASGVLTDVAGGGNTFDYTLSVSNSSAATGTVGSFWYAWVPGQFYLPSQPSSATAPLGWSATITPGGGTYGIQYVATNSGARIAAGGSLSVNFISTDTPTTLAGNAAAHPLTPIGTTVAYSGALFSDGGDQFVFQSVVPEPSTLALLGIAAVFGLGATAWRRLCRS